MQKFTVKIIIHVILIILLLEGISSYILSTKNYFSDRIPWAWLMYHENHAGKNINSDTLYLGCSVGGQLFPFWMKSNNYTTVGNCMLATDFILSNRIFKTNQNIKDIVIVATPRGIVYGFEQERTYNSFVKPFYTFQNLRYFDRFLFRKIAEKPMALLSLFNFAKILPIANHNFNAEQPHDQLKLSDFSIYYINKLVEFAKSHNIRLTFVAPPIRAMWKEKTNDWLRLKEDINNKGFSNHFNDYFNNLYYLPDSCFMDEFHFKKDFIRNNRGKLVRELKIQMHIEK